VKYKKKVRNDFEKKRKKYLLKKINCQKKKIVKFVNKMSKMSKKMGELKMD
jgi:hypothetical protein